MGYPVYFANDPSVQKLNSVEVNDTVRLKMKAIFATLVLLFSLCGCSEPKHVSVVEFKNHYSDVGQINSMRSAYYLGVREGKAFIKIGSMRLGGGWKERVVYVLLAELDESFRDELLKKGRTQSATANALDLT